MKDYYSILGLPRFASEEEIKEAYRRLALRWHPDLNMDDDEARQKMQDLNRAKEVLFDKETRDEYKKLLDTQDALSYENLQRIRKKYKAERDARTIEIDKLYPVRRRQVVILFISLAIIGAGLFYVMKSNSVSITTEDPIKDFTNRHNQSVHIPGSVPAGEAIPNVGLDALERMASVSAMMGDYKTAIVYWRSVLDRGEYHLSTVVNVALSYMKIYNYDGAFEVESHYIKTVHDKIIFYSLLGDYFKSNHEIFDAQDMYKAALALVPGNDSLDAAIEEAITRSKEGSVIK